MTEMLVRDDVGTTCLRTAGALAILLSRAAFRQPADSFQNDR